MKASEDKFPTELLTLIVENLQFPDTAHARATCHTLASLISEQPSHYLDLLAAEGSTWVIKRRRLTCVYCARMRPVRFFTDRQKIRKAEYRACVDCLEAQSGVYDGLTGWRCVVPRNPHRTRCDEWTRQLEVDG